MKISKPTKFIVAFCAFFIGAIPAYFMSEKVMNPGKVYLVNCKVLAWIG